MQTEQTAAIKALLNDDTAAAHIYPSTLKTFERGEHVGECFSIKVGSPDEDGPSVGVFTIGQVTDAFAALATKPAGAADSTEPVAWRYVPSKVWKDFVFTDKPENADYARSIGVQVEPLYTSPIAAEAVPPASCAPATYSSTQATNCAGCGERKHTPLRIDAMGGYVCLTCIDQKLGSLLGEFGYPDASNAAEPAGGEDDYDDTKVPFVRRVRKPPSAVPAGLSDAQEAARYRFLRKRSYRRTVNCADGVVGLKFEAPQRDEWDANQNTEADLDCAIDAALAASAPGAKGEKL